MQKMKKNELSIANNILLALMLNSMVTRQSINLFSDKQSNVSMAVKTLKEKKFIKEKNKAYKDRCGNRSIKRNYKILTITRKGINYFTSLDLDKNLKEYESFKWVCEFPKDINKVRISPAISSIKTLIGVTNIATANLFSTIMNASYSPCFIGDAFDAIEEKNDIDELQDDEEQGSVIYSKEENELAFEDQIDEDKDEEKNESPYLRDLVMQAIEDRQSYPVYDDHYFIGNDFQIRFTNRKIIRHICRMHEADVSFILYIRYAGIFESDDKKVITYVAPKKGMDWASWVVSPEMTAYRYYCAYGGKNPDGKTVALMREMYGCLLVENERQFEDIFFDTKNKRNLKIQENDPLGREFERFVVFPISQKGAMAFKNYLLQKENADREKIIEQNLKSDMFLKNESYAPLVFPLVDKANTHYYIDTEIDIKMIRQLNFSANKRPDLKYVIVCYEWQKSYYDRVLTFEHEFATFG